MKGIAFSIITGSIMVLTSFACFGNGFTEQTTQNVESTNGWQYHDDNWYYYNDSGAKVTGWIRDSANWYYLSEDGVMLADAITPDGYYVESSGAWIPDAQKYWGIDFGKNDIKNIEFYNIPVPATAKMKLIVLPEDITCLYNTIANSIVSSEDEESRSGGGYKIVIVKHDGSRVELFCNPDVIRFAGENYVLKNTIPFDELWESMDYIETSIPQDQIP